MELVFGNLFKLFSFAIRFAREVYHLGVKMKTNMTIVLFFSLSPSLKSVNKLPNTRVFIADEKGWLEVLELVAFFLLKTGTCDAKNS